MDNKMTKLEPKIAQDLEELIEHFKQLSEIFGNGTLNKIKESNKDCKDMLKLVDKMEDILGE